MDWLLPSCPGTPVQGLGRKPSGGPGRGLHLGRCTPLWPSGAGYMLGRDKASCKPAERPAARSSMTPHAIVNQLKTILNSQASEQNVSECSLKNFSTDSCVVYSIYKEWNTFTIRLCSAHKLGSAFPWTCLMEFSPESQLKVTSGTEHTFPGQPSACPATLPHPTHKLTFKFKCTQCSLSSLPLNVL